MSCQFNSITFNCNVKLQFYILQTLNSLSYSEGNQSIQFIISQSIWYRSVMLGLSHSPLLVTIMNFNSSYTYVASLVPLSRIQFEKSTARLNFQQKIITFEFPQKKMAESKPCRGKYSAVNESVNFSPCDNLHGIPICFYFSWNKSTCFCIILVMWRQWRPGIKFNRSARFALLLFCLEHNYNE